MHDICHIEFEVLDLPRAQAFYAGMFGWQFRQFMDTMVVFGDGEKHIGGLTKVDSIAPGKSPSVWLEVASVEEALAKAKSLGGSVLGEKSEVPTVGFSGVVGDPDGNRVGVVEFAAKPE
jgi:predicted enzyme related to lactoylglutathione lyase